MIIHAVTNMVGQTAALAFSIDAPLKILLNDADQNLYQVGYVNVTVKGTLVNGYMLTGILVGIIILLPIIWYQRYE